MHAKQINLLLKKPLFFFVFYCNDSAILTTIAFFICSGAHSNKEAENQVHFPSPMSVPTLPVISGSPKVSR